MSILSSRELALHVAHIAWEKDGQDLRVMGFPPGHGLCDFCVLVTGRSDRQIRAIAEEVSKFAKSRGLSLHPVEGDSGWMLVDMGEVVVHAFGTEQRKQYALDALWPHTKTIDHEAAFRKMKLLKTAPVSASEPAGL